MSENGKMDTTALEFCREPPPQSLGVRIFSSTRLVSVLISTSSFLTSLIHLSTEAGVPSHKLVAEVDNFHKLAVNEKYQLRGKFST